MLLSHLKLGTEAAMEVQRLWVALQQELVQAPQQEDMANHQHNKDMANPHHNRVMDSPHHSKDMASNLKVMEALQHSSARQTPHHMEPCPCSRSPFHSLVHLEEVHVTLEFLGVTMCFIYKYIKKMGNYLHMYAAILNMLSSS